jgi:hypothetical protein
LSPSTVLGALIEIRSLGGRQFDPSVVEAFETLDHRKLLSLTDAAASPMASLPLLRTRS